MSIELPTITIEPQPLDWLQQLPSLETIAKAIFISAPAVDYFFQGLKTAGIPWPQTIQTYAIGKATACALTYHRVIVTATPTTPDSEHLLTLDVWRDIQHQSILLISGNTGRPLIAKTLRERGAIVLNLEVYQRRLPKKNFKYTHTLWQDDAIDIILMMSQQAIENLFALFEDEARTWIQSKPCIVISPRLEDIARRYGMQTVIMSPYDELLNTLARVTQDHGR